MDKYTFEMIPGLIEHQGPDGLYADASCCAYDLWVCQECPIREIRQMRRLEGKPSVNRSAVDCV